jgi:hypothetical protein
VRWRATGDRGSNLIGELRVNFAEATPKCFFAGALVVR